MQRSGGGCRCARRWHPVGWRHRRRGFSFSAFCPLVLPTLKIWSVLVIVESTAGSSRNMALSQSTFSTLLLQNTTFTGCVPASFNPPSNQTTHPLPFFPVASLFFFFPPPPSHLPANTARTHARTAHTSNRCRITPVSLSSKQALIHFWLSFLTPSLPPPLPLSCAHAFSLFACADDDGCCMVAMAGFGWKQQQPHAVCRAAA